MAETWQGIRLSVCSDPQYLSPIRAVVREATSILGFSDEESTEVQLAVQEGCANVIRHAYKDSHDKRIDLEFRFEPGELVILIDDYGTFVDPARMKGRELCDLKPGGLGVHFMRQTMDVVNWTRNAWGGTTLTLVKRARRDARPKEDAAD